MSPSPAGKSRVSILETRSRVVPVVTRNIPGAPDPGAPDPGAPDPGVLRSALRKDLNQGALLQADGLVRTETGRGTFIQDIPKVKRVRRIPPGGNGSASSFAEEMRKAGLTPTTKPVQAEARIPPAAVTGRLELGDDEQDPQAPHVHRRAPAHLAVSYIPLSVAGSTDARVMGHTDIDDYAAVCQVLSPALQPGGIVHPCYVGAFVERSNPAGS
jgi:hypothetical protein